MILETHLIKILNDKKYRYRNVKNVYINIC